MVDVFKMLSDIAAANKNDPRFQQVEKYSKEMPIQPGGMAGFTKTQMTPPFIKWLFHPEFKKITPREEIAQSLRVIANAPKKVIEDLKSFNLDPHKPLTGYYRRFNPFQSGTGKIWTAKASHETPYNVPDVLSHELGHGASWRILEKLKGTPTQRESMYDTIWQGEWEGIAEYLGNYLNKRAGVKATPVFPYGAFQERAFKDLSQMPSKNPYMNVYRYLNNMMKPEPAVRVWRHGMEVK